MAPVPGPDRELHHALLRFYHGIARADIGLHLASIAALDSAVCLILAALLEPDRVLAQEPTANAIFRRIHRDEAGHVRLSRRIAAESRCALLEQAVENPPSEGAVRTAALQGEVERLGFDLWGRRLAVDRYRLAPHAGVHHICSVSGRQRSKAARVVSRRKVWSGIDWRKCRQGIMRMRGGYCASPISAASPRRLQMDDTRVDTMNFPQSGGCLWGAVHYEIIGPPVIV